MSIEINFELSDSDLEHFRNMMKAAIAKNNNLSDGEIIAKARDLVASMEKANLPEFVSTRLLSLQTLIDAVLDEEWQMPEDEKKEIMASLAYFGEPEDIVPDHIPVLGFIDDAIMIELVLQELSLDLKAYREFCGFRATEEARRGDAAKVDRDSWLAGTRAQIRSSMRRTRSKKSSRLLSRIM
ncbi:YkvA family protein (plasmid) [Pseudoalteromonas sp. T1lg65]|uniref:YkvA family protein n=1 Tax=Pseudoalteromonas sp. T1lg65 TaxID=2077101 RepID=UPI003F799441